jgi:homoserine kinase type II
LSNHRPAPPDLSAIVSILQDYGIAGNRIALSSPAQGADNWNVFVDVDDRRYVLRLYHVTLGDEIEYELHLVDYLTSRGFPTPRVHHRADGAMLSRVGSIPAALFDFVDGVQPTAPNRAFAPRIASLIADFHRLTEGRSFPGRRNRTDIGRLEAFVRLVHDDDRFASTAGVRGFFESMRDSLTSFGDDTRRAALIPSGAIHHDPHSTNILIDNAGKIVALLDFDEAYNGYLLFDIAAVLANWARPELDSVSTVGNGVFDSQSLEAIVTAYHRRRPVGVEESRALPSAILVFYAADAAEYLMRQWRKTGGAMEVRDCLSLRAYYALRETEDWRVMLKTILDEACE